jgi:hypothetical protein
MARLSLVVGQVQRGADDRVRVDPDVRAELRGNIDRR